MFYRTVWGRDDNVRSDAETLARFLVCFTKDFQRPTWLPESLVNFFFIAFACLIQQMNKQQ